MDSKIHIHKNKIRDLTELRIVGRLDSSTASLLSQALEEEVKAGHYKIILNLLETDFLSSAAIRVLIQYYKELRSKRGFLMVQPSDAVRSTITMVGLADLFSSPAQIAQLSAALDYGDEFLRRS